MSVTTCFIYYLILNHFRQGLSLHSFFVVRYNQECLDQYYNMTEQNIKYIMCECALTYTCISDIYVLFVNLFLRYLCTSNWPFDTLPISCHTSIQVHRRYLFIVVAYLRLAYIYTYIHIDVMIIIWFHFLTCFGSTYYLYSH